MTGSSDEAEDRWRPACGACGSTGISVTTASCSACGEPWDGSELPEPTRDDEHPTAPAAAPRAGKGQ